MGDSAVEGAGEGGAEGGEAWGEVCAKVEQKQKGHAMAKVFISYVQENSVEVARLVEDLKSNGIDVWMDKDSLLPGERWKDKIRDNIKNGDFFIACFSEQYHHRNSTYMNEELVVAIEELRKRSSDRAWFIPVVLNECNVPARNIGAGETLLDLHWANLHSNWNEGIQKMLNVILSDELESAKAELNSLAKWIKKREAYNYESLDLFREKYYNLKSHVFEKFGVDYDPRAKI